MNTLQLPERAISRSEMVPLVEKIRENVLETHSSLQAYVKLYNLHVLLGETLKALKEGALRNMSTKTEEVYGATVEMRGLPKSWDYGDDPHLKGLIDLKERAQQAVDDWIRIRQLQKMDLVDAGTGRVIPPPVQKNDGVTLAVTLPK